MSKDTVMTAVSFVVRWALKFAAGWLTAVGISQNSAEEVAIGIASFLVGVVISWYQHKKDLNTPVP